MSVISRWPSRASVPTVITLLALILSLAHTLIERPQLCACQLAWKHSSRWSWSALTFRPIPQRLPRYRPQHDLKSLVHTC